MFDWLRNMRKSAAEKRQEAVSAYLDDALSPREKAAFEAQLRQDESLRAELEAQRSVKLLLRQMPRLRAPRNFVLDPAVYGRQAPAPIPWTTRLYPQLRAATLVATLLFAVSLTLNLAPLGGGRDMAMQESDSVAVLSEPAAAPSETEAEAELFAVEEAEVVEDMAAEEPLAAEIVEEEAPAAAMEMMETAAEESGEQPGEMAAAAADEPPSNGAGAVREGTAAENAAATMVLEATPSPAATAEPLSPRPSPTPPAGRAATPPAAAGEEIASAPAGESQVEPAATRSEIDGLLLAQIALGLLAAALLTVTLSARRRAR